MQDEFDNRMGPDDDLMGGSTMSEMGTPAGDTADVAGRQPAMRPSGGVRKSSGTRRAARRTSARKGAKKKSSKKKGSKKKGARKAARKRSKTRARSSKRKGGRRR